MKLEVVCSLQLTKRCAMGAYTGLGGYTCISVETVYVCVIACVPCVRMCECKCEDEGEGKGEGGWMAYQARYLTLLNINIHVPIYFSEFRLSS